MSTKKPGHTPTSTEQTDPPGKPTTTNTSTPSVQDTETGAVYRSKTPEVTVPLVPFKAKAIDMDLVADLEKKTKGVVDARTDEIALMVRRLRWDTHRSPKLFAAKWKVSETYVRSLWRAACRKVSDEMTDHDYAMSFMTAALERLVLESFGPRGNRKHIVPAAKLYAELVGARTVNVNNIRQDNLPDDPEKLLQIMRDIAVRAGASPQVQSGQLTEHAQTSIGTGQTEWIAYPTEVPLEQGTSEVAVVPEVHEAPKKGDAG